MCDLRLTLEYVEFWCRARATFVARRGPRCGRGPGAGRSLLSCPVLCALVLQSAVLGVVCNGVVGYALIEHTRKTKGWRGPLVKDPPLCPHTTLLGVLPLVRTRKRPRQEPMRSLAQPFSSPSSYVWACGRALLSTRRASQLSSRLPIGRAAFLPVISSPQPARRPWISSSPASWGPWPESETACPTAHHR